MADTKLLKLLNKGIGAWNAMRPRADRTALKKALSPLGRRHLLPDLSHADLRGRNLVGIDLSGVNLWRANLTLAILTNADLSDADANRATFRDADLSGANLSSALLVNAYFSGANLTGANFTAAMLTGTNLWSAVMKQTTLTHAAMGHTILGDVDLSSAIGLESCTHYNVSTIDVRTLLRSPLPLAFLRGCGVPDRFIDYLPSLLDSGPIRFYSCFISYSTADQAFAERLHADLQDRGIRCWFAPHDMQGGRKVHDQIDEAIRVYDRLLLILSTESMRSPWVKREIQRAREKERTLDREVLFPIGLVPFTDIRAWNQFDSDHGEDLAAAARAYHIPDFSDWKNHDGYLAAFEKLVTALNSVSTAGDGFRSDTPAPR